MVETPKEVRTCAVCEQGEPETPIVEWQGDNYCRGCLDELKQRLAERIRERLEQIENKVGVNCPHCGKDISHTASVSGLGSSRNYYCDACKTEVWIEESDG